MRSTAIILLLAAALPSRSASAQLTNAKLEPIPDPPAHAYVPEPAGSVEPTNDTPLWVLLATGIGLVSVGAGGAIASAVRADDIRKEDLAFRPPPGGIFEGSPERCTFETLTWVGIGAAILGTFLVIGSIAGLASSTREPRLRLSSARAA